MSFLSNIFHNLLVISSSFGFHKKVSILFSGSPFVKDDSWYISPLKKFEFKPDHQRRRRSDFHLRLLCKQSKNQNRVHLVFLCWFSLLTAILKFRDSKVGRLTPKFCSFLSSSETVADGSLNISVVSQDQSKWILSDGNLMERSEKMMWSLNWALHPGGSVKRWCPCPTSIM